MKYILKIWLMMGCFYPLFGQTYNRPVPPDLFSYHFNSYTATTGKYLFAPFKLNDPTALIPKPVIIDENGYVFWYMNSIPSAISNFSYFPQHQLFGFNVSSPGNVTYRILDLNLNIVDSFSNTNGIVPDGHELKIMSNGNYLIAGEKDSVMDLTGYTFNGTPGTSTTNVVGFVIQEFDASHNLIFQWNSNDYIFPTEAYDQYGFNAAAFDYCHGNAIEEDTDGNLLVSFRHLNSVYKIDHNNGNVIWKLGGKSSDFIFTNDSAFSGQHDVRRLPNGNISVFDNANTSPPPKKTRGVEFIVDTNTWTATKVWEYIHTPFFFTKATGSHQTSGNNHFIDYGLIFRPRPSAVMVDYNGNLLSDFYFQDSVMSYRGFVYDIPFSFNQPSISCNNDGTTITLTAPSGFTNYQWNTGETSSSIVVSQPDTFQVWVNFGEGMLGSTPIIITNLQSNCMANIGEENTIITSNIIGYYNLLGQEIDAPIVGQIYIALYSDGSKKLKYIIY